MFKPSFTSLNPSKDHHIKDSNSLESFGGIYLDLGLVQSTGTSSKTLIILVEQHWEIIKCQRPFATETKAQVLILDHSTKRDIQSNIYICRRVICLFIINICEMD